MKFDKNKSSALLPPLLFLTHGALETAKVWSQQFKNE